MRRLTVISLVFILITFSMPTTSLIAESTNKTNSKSDKLSVDEIVNNDKTKKVFNDENGTEIIRITNPQSLKAIESNLQKPDPSKKLKSFEIHRKNNINLNTDDEITPQIITSLIRTGTRRACGVTQIPGARRTGKGPLTLNVSHASSTTISGGGGVTLKIINANLGVSLQETTTVSGGTEFSSTSDPRLPPGETGVIQAYEEFNLIDYDIYRFGIKWGNGTVQYGDGVCFSKWY